MEDFEGRIAVITGGGTGMGRELARQLAAAGAHIAICDVSDDNMAETKSLCEGDAPAGTRHHDVRRGRRRTRSRVIAFRDAVATSTRRTTSTCCSTTPGIGGGGSFVDDARAEWDKTFAVCWGGVYHCTRAFLPMLLGRPQRATSSTRAASTGSGRRSGR
jgi:NAD(P)-dependent dehydrogenase (short-subunit alcohol dehydrogenase family)